MRVLFAARSYTMYVVDSLDTVVELKTAPQSDIGAPLPLVVADEHHLILEYLVSDPDPNWDGTYARVVSSNTDGTVAIVRFRHPYAHSFGPPNDEAFAGHPLASRGLRPYGVFETQQSSWLRQLEQMNSVHPHHDQKRFMESKRHFVFAFHDTTFECVAEGFDVAVHQGSILSSIERIVPMLEEDPA